MDTIYHFNKEFFLNPCNYDGIKIFQIGRAFCQPNTIIHTHIHSDLFELTLVTCGKGTIVTNGTPMPVRQNDIYLSFPFDAHKIISDASNPLNFDFLAFHTDNPDFKNDLDFIMENFLSTDKRVFRDERIFTLVGNAIEEYGNDKIYSSKLLASAFHGMMIYLIRDFNNIAPEKLPKNIKTTDSLCLQMMRYIETHIFTIKSLEEIADSMGYQYNYLSTLFKKTSSVSLSRYYREKKLEIASMLILEGNLKITEIACRLNYSSVYAFSKAFHKQYGCSPRNYCANKKAETLQP